MARRHKIATGGVSNANETRGYSEKTNRTPPDGGVAPCHGVGREPGDGSPENLNLSSNVRLKNNFSL